MNGLETQLNDILESAIIQVSDIEPSDWAEQNRYLTSEETSMSGQFSFDRAPYCKMLLNTCKSTHPARTIVGMKAAQVGLTKSVIENIIGYRVAEEPCPILFLTGHADLSEEAMENIDKMFDNTGLRPLIRSTSLRKSGKTGDTAHSKEFAGGSIRSGSVNNHKLLRQRSVEVVIVDDFDAAKKSDKSSGDTAQMVIKRQSAFRASRKTYFISSPELKENSNVYPLYLQGDQQKYHIPCPCCGEMIILYWSVELDDKSGMGGITWQLNDDSELVDGSVGYICQKCGGFFDEDNKNEWLNLGEWFATTKAKDPTILSFHISSLYATSTFFDWEHYVRQYLQACPPDQPRDESLYKAFVTLVLGEPYEQEGIDIQANELQNNIRRYEVGTVPEKMSIADGNGRIVLLTCGADMNGKEDDARLDWEIVAHSESGATYSVKHGSIGTFIPRENTMKYKVDREHWSYRHEASLNVWDKFGDVLTGIYETDTGRAMRVHQTALDVGYMDQYAWVFIDSGIANVVGVKGDGKGIRRFTADTKTFRVGKERNKLYIAESNLIKDQLAAMVGLRWDRGNQKDQPKGFMNFPSPSEGLYQYANFFSHYEAEHRVIDKEGTSAIGFTWQKKNSAAQNHLFDCRCYNIMIRDVIVHEICEAAARETKMIIKNPTWADLVNLVR